jgi:hypothetical protein
VLISEARSAGLSAAEISATAMTICAAQRGDGAIPWELGRQLDPWNHVEAILALDAAGCHGEARRGLEWLRRTQADDGTWPALISASGGKWVDVNFTAYIAIGAWHHFLCTRDRGYLATLWPTLRRALDFTVSMQAPGGEIYWARDNNGDIYREALLTASSSVRMSLTAGIEIAAIFDKDCRSWSEARHRLTTAIRQGTNFARKDAYAMDWYYPVLSGALDQASARARLLQRWRWFVTSSGGVRCVRERPWATVAETCELVIALAMVGWDAEALRLFEWTRALRGADGSYWTGVVCPSGEIWPDERTTWTAASVLLSNALLERRPSVTALFRLPGPAQDPQAAYVGDLLVLPARTRRRVNLKRRSAPARGIRKHVVDGEQAARE